MSFKKELKSFIIDWNIRFRYDRMWRQKYNIPFGSDKHREVSQIDIYLDILEDKLFLKAQKERLYREEAKEQLKKGIFIKEKQLTQEEEDALFKGIKF